MSPSKSKYWKQTGPAHAKLLELVNDGTIDLNDDINQSDLKEVYNNHEEFQEFPFDRFVAKVIEMKKKVVDSTTMLQCKYSLCVHVIMLPYLIVLIVLLQ